MQHPGLEETLSQWPPAEELLVPGAVVIEAEKRATLKDFATFVELPVSRIFSKKLELGFRI
jgi:hypothetical protein